MPANARSTRSSPYWRAAGICLALAVITFAVFGQTVRHQFVNFDDPEYVAKNPIVAQGLTFKGLVWAFAHPHSANWHPLTWLSHMLDCEFYGVDPVGHHFTNVLLHAATAMALFLVLLRMTGSLWRSAFVAAVFAIHPLRVESVAWVSERKDVLSGLFFMLTLLAYARYVSSVQGRVPGMQSARCEVRGASDGGRRVSGVQRSMFGVRCSMFNPWYCMALLLFMLGLLSKPMLVTLPVVLLLLDYWPLRRFELSTLTSRASTIWRLLLEKLPFFALSATSSVMTLLAQSGAMKSFESFPLAARIWAAVSSYKTYLVQMVYPTGLAAFYPFPLHSSLRGTAVAALLLFAISAIAWGERRTRPWLLMGWLWYLVMLLPVLGLVQVGGQAHADRYTYLPQIGIYVAVTWLAADLAAKWRLGWLPMATLMSLLLVMLMAYAWKQTTYWKNSETLWRHALDCTAGNNLAYINLGHELFEQRRLDEVISHYEKGLEIQPNNRQFHNNLANALREQGRLDEAIVHYEKAAEIDPGLAEAQFNLAKALGLIGRMVDSISRYEIVLRIEPGFLPARMSLGNALLQRGKPDIAAMQFKKLLELRPSDAGAHLNLGLCFVHTGKMEEARSEYEKALQLAPGDPGIQNNLAWLLATCPTASLRDGSRAVELARDANVLSGGEKPLILRTLAAALAETGRFPEAIEAAQRASALAEAQSMPDLVKQIQIELNLYRVGKPFAGSEPAR